MQLKTSFLDAWHLLKEPKQNFTKLGKRSFEEQLSYYLWQLLLCSLLAAALRLIIITAKALYYDIFRTTAIDYVRLLNYALGLATGTLFFYLFAGTFILFALSLVIRPFISLPYVRLLQTLFLSLSPLLIFGWVYMAVPGLIIWSVMLTIIGVSASRNLERGKKGTIMERD